jgi:long-chain fatty acid transport protein
VQDGYLSAETPDSDRIGLSVGLGYKFSDNFNLDLSFLYINGKERTQTAEHISSAGTQADVIAGTYKTQVYIPGVGISYKF